MNTIEINKILSRNPITAKYYLGCFASDQLTNFYNFNFSHPQCFVVNFDSSNSEGTHWVALYSSNPNDIEYYDSLGIWPPPSTDLFNYLAQFAHLRYSKYQFQSHLSNACGKHAIFFLYNRCRGISFEKILKILYKNYRNADNFVTHFLREVIFKGKCI